MDTFSPEAMAKPYKGPQSYQVEDGFLFFGRDAAAEQLVAKILSSRLTLLHAQSGAGKTSLLNARVIPNLESRRWLAVRVLPQNDPIASARHAILEYLLPPPEAEIYAIHRLVNALAAGDDQTIGESLAHYDALPRRDARKRTLIAPVDRRVLDGASSQQKHGHWTPYLCRLLRSSLGLEDLRLHWDAVAQGEGGAGPAFGPVTAETRFSDLISRLQDSAFQGACQGISAALDTPVPGLLAFVDNLVQVYGSRVPHFSLVLLFDQFEELFTRFVDLGPATPAAIGRPPDYRLRWELIAELERIHRASEVGEAGVKGVRPLSVRCVLSMRSEYIAQLDPFRRFASDLDANAYHLQLLTCEEADEAIQQPAREYGYGYAQDCYRAILEDLTKEERFVEPAHLQIVCEKLWNTRGRDLAEREKKGRSTAEGIEPAQGEQDQAREVDLAAYKGLGRSAGIMRDFLRGFLEKLDSADRLETLEILEPLITSAGTRNIVERTQLVTPPFRNGKHREQLLAGLVNRAVVRVESRLGGQFAEITHEFLIPPVLEVIQQWLYQEVPYNRFRLAVRALDRFQYAGLEKSSDPVLTKQEFEDLNEQRERVKWNKGAARAMLCSAAVYRAEEAVLREWLSRLQSAEVEEKAAEEAPAQAEAAPMEAEAAARSGSKEAREKLAETLLDAPDPRKREAGLPLLRLIASEECLRRLADCALTDENKEVRERAVAELQKLEPKAATTAYQMLADNLSDAALAKRAYLVLGRLRAEGAAVPRARLGWGTRIRLAASLFGSLYPHGITTARGLGGVRRWLQILAYYLKFYFFQGIVPGLIGGMLGVLAASVLLPFCNNLEWFTFLFMGLFISPFIVALAGLRSTPIALHYDRLAGALINLSWAGVAALSLAWLYAFSQSEFFLVLPLTGAALVARLGVMLACGSVPGRLGYRCFQITVGSCAALLWSTVVLAAMALENKPYHIGITNEFLTMISIFIFALATIYASIDAEPQSPAPIIGWAGRTVCILIVVIVAVPLFAFGSYRYHLAHAKSDISKLPVEKTVESLPFVLNLELSEDQQELLVSFQSGPTWVTPVLRDEYGYYGHLGYAEREPGTWKINLRILLARGQETWEPVRNYGGRPFELGLHPGSWEFVPYVLKNPTRIWSALQGRIPLESPLQVQVKVWSAAADTEAPPP